MVCLPQSPFSSFLVLAAFPGSAYVCAAYRATPWRATDEAPDAFHMEGGRPRPPKTNSGEHPLSKSTVSLSVPRAPSDGLVLGSQAFVDSIFARYRSQFSPNRKSGARPLRFGDWQGLCSLRDLRFLPVSKS